MGVEKSELKRTLLQGLAREAAERSEALQAEVYRVEGGVRALDKVLKGIERDVYTRLRRDIDESKFDPDTGKQVDRYVQTCMNFVKHVGKQLTEQLGVQRGRAMESAEMGKMLLSSAEAEGKKIEAVEAAKEAGAAVEDDGSVEEVPSEEKGPARRPAGVRPAPSLKARRTAQEPPPPEIDLRGGAFEKPAPEPPPAPTKPAPEAAGEEPPSEEPSKEASPAQPRTPAEEPPPEKPKRRRAKKASTKKASTKKATKPRKPTRPTRKAPSVEAEPDPGKRKADRREAAKERREAAAKEAEKEALRRKRGGKNT